MLPAERLSTPECSVVCYIFAVGQSIIIWLEASISNLPANNDDGLVSAVWDDSPSLRGSSRQPTAAAPDFGPIIIPFSSQKQGHSVL